MKKSIFLFVVFAIFVQALSNAQTKEFTIAYSGTYPNWNPETNPTNWSWYNELNVNLWQGWGIGEAAYHGFILDSLYSHNISGYFQPDTMMQFALGKVIVHQAESNTADSFRYMHHSLGKDTTETFQGETVTSRYFDVGTIPVNERGIPEAVLTGVKENAVHSFSGLVLDPKKQWRWEANGYQKDNRWYIKPRMRIDSADAFGTAKNVIKIVVRSFDGEIVYEKNISTDRFIGQNGYYGRFLEDFFTDGISVPATSTGTGINRGFPPGLDHRDKYEYFDSCKVDFEIHWYKDVSVWIDYIKIMDEPAYLLHNQNSDVRNALKRQIQRLLNHSGGSKVRGFYTEEIEYTNLRCLEYIQDSLIPQAVSNPSVRMNCLLNPWSFQHNLRSIDSANRYEEYLDRVKPPELYLAVYPEQGPFGDYRAPLPNNIDSFYFPSDQPPEVKEKFEDFFFEPSNNFIISTTAYNQNLQTIWTKYENLLEYFKGEVLSRGKDYVSLIQLLHEHLKHDHPSIIQTSRKS